MRSRSQSNNKANVRAKALRTKRREEARRWFYEENIPKVEIQARLGVTPQTVNSYLRQQLR